MPLQFSHTVEADEKFAALRAPVAVGGSCAGYRPPGWPDGDADAGAGNCWTGAGGAAAGLTVRLPCGVLTGRAWEFTAPEAGLTGKA